MSQFTEELVDKLITAMKCRESGWGGAIELFLRECALENATLTRRLGEHSAEYSARIEALKWQMGVQALQVTLMRKALERIVDPSVSSGRPDFTVDDLRTIAREALADDKGAGIKRFAVQVQIGKIRKGGPLPIDDEMGAG